MINTSGFAKLTENEVSKQLKVSNPQLLKTGVLGLLVNLMTIAKTDNANFLNQLVREASPVTAETYESLFFHSSVRQEDIQFSTPANMKISFLIPEVKILNGEVLKYTLTRETEFIDQNGYHYTLEDPIEIHISAGSVIGKKHTATKIEDLDVFKIKNPNDPTTNLYILNTDVKQYERKFKIITVPETGDESYKFTMDIESISSIYEINVWRQINTEKSLSTIGLKNIKTENIGSTHELQALDIKYTKNLSNQAEEHIFLKFEDLRINFETGDGVYGKKIPAGTKLLVELKTTKGAYGNVTTAEFNLQDIILQQILPDGTVSQRTTSMKALCMYGATGGRNLESKEEIRRRLTTSNGNYIGSMSDIRNAFYLDNGEPFITKKYFNSQHHIFIYNILRDTAGNIIPSTTKNIKFEELMDQAFMPEIVYNGVDLISPFYYVNFNSKINAYLVLPEVQIELVPESGTSNIKMIENNPSLYLTYDWFEKTTYLELRSINVNYTYIVETNINTFKFSAANSFRIEINKTFLNQYCLLDGFAKDAYNPDSEEVIKVPGYLTNINMTVFHNDIKVLRFEQANNKKYVQTVLKQEHYYWIDVDMFDVTKENKYVLNIPFIDKSFISNDIITIATKLDDFFKIKKDEKNINPNLSLCQALYNTISIEDIYRNYIFDTADLYTQPNVFINMEVDLDSLQLSRSKWKSTIDVENDIQWISQSFLSQLEGFKLDFNESQLENQIMKHFNASYPVIKNIKVWNPSGPIRVRSSAEIQSMFEENYGLEHQYSTDEEISQLVAEGKLPTLTQKRIVDFTPPYFTFNKNITIDFKLN